MKIYGIEIVMPHSGDVSRTVATKNLKQSLIENYGTNLMQVLKKASTKELKEMAKGFETLHLIDLNGKIKSNGLH